MTLGNIWGTVFFLFMFIAAISTMIAVFESIIAGCIELLKLSRIKAVIINMVIILTICLLPLLGYNVLSDVHIIGPKTDLLDFFDFLVSNNIMPIGSVVFVLFVCAKSGMTFKRYVDECNIGKGFKISGKLYFHYKYILRYTIVAVVLVIGYIQIIQRFNFLKLT